ncbi:MAG: NAD(+) kinase [Pseudomonadota bacterium]|nr:NAD(+) kinase [Pseudomonadota bacterium]|tara:strand:- start:398 stop:1303 length:906 start_codon:yes stop_codon:yes gene_type:complete
MKNSTFQVVGLWGRPKALVAQTLDSLIEWLNKKGYTAVLESSTAVFMPDRGLQIASSQMMGEICDIVIVVGGDGCLLGAARTLARYNVPILGVNRGQLGFLTDIMPHALEAQMEQVFDGKYTIEKRFLLDGSLTRDGHMIAASEALNDVVLHAGKAVQMINFELHVNGEFVYSQKSDGLIVATPTGSTAYALSAGGPMMHPGLDAIALVPMCPHTLTNRPFVVGGDMEIKLVLAESRGVLPHISFDGQPSIPAQPGDVIYIRKKPHRLQLIHPHGHTFYAAARSKLGWASRLTEKGGHYED